MGWTRPIPPATPAQAESVAATAAGPSWAEEYGEFATGDEDAFKEWERIYGEAAPHDTGLHPAGPKAGDGFGGVRG